VGNISPLWQSVQLKLGPVYWPRPSLMLATECKL